MIRVIAVSLVLLLFGNGVLSLTITPLAPPANDAEKANLKALQDALVLANTHITDMEAVLNTPDDAAHKKIIEATFGKDPTRDFGFIKNTVARLKGGNVPVKLPLAAGAGTIAFTFYDNSHNPMTPLHIEFGKKFYIKNTITAQAATLIHEATHYLADTGDYIIQGAFVHGSNPATSSSTGYTSQLEPYTTVEDINKDKAWVRMRDGFKPAFPPDIPPVKSMHLNAESYAQLSSIAGHAAGHFRDADAEFLLVVQD